MWIGPGKGVGMTAETASGSYPTPEPQIQQGSPWICANSRSGTDSSRPIASQMYSTESKGINVLFLQGDFWQHP